MHARAICTSGTTLEGPECFFEEIDPTIHEKPSQQADIERAWGRTSKVSDSLPKVDSKNIIYIFKKQCRDESKESDKWDLVFLGTSSYSAKSQKFNECTLTESLSASCIGRLFLHSNSFRES